MDEISQQPRRDFRLPPGPRRWLALVGVTALVATISAVGVSRLGGQPGARAPGVPSASVSLGSESVIEASLAPLRGSPVTSPALLQVLPAPTSPVSRAIPAAGTVLLTCDSVDWAQPDSNWQADSLRVGPLWLLDARHLGYARLGQTRPAAAGETGHGGGSRDVEMLVHVGAGSTVVMRAAAGTSPYFEFLNSPGTTGDYQGLDGGGGFTFVPCPAADSGDGGLIALYDVGFSIVPGHTASVEVWTAPSARPVWLTFTAPASRG
jgi:hypothetical protein